MEVMENVFKNSKIKVSNGELKYSDILLLLFRESRPEKAEMGFIKYEKKFIEMIKDNKDSDDIELTEEQVAFLKNRFNDKTVVPYINEDYFETLIDYIQKM